MPSPTVPLTGLPVYHVNGIALTSLPHAFGYRHPGNVFYPMPLPTAAGLYGPHDDGSYQTIISRSIYGLSTSLIVPSYLQANYPNNDGTDGTTPDWIYFGGFLDPDRIHTADPSGTNVGGDSNYFYLYLAGQSSFASLPSSYDLGSPALNINTYVQAQVCYGNLDNSYVADDTRLAGTKVTLTMNGDGMTPYTVLDPTLADLNKAAITYGSLSGTDDYAAEVARTGRWRCAYEYDVAGTPHYFSFQPYTGYGDIRTSITPPVQYDPWFGCDPTAARVAASLSYRLDFPNGHTAQGAIGVSGWEAKGNSSGAMTNAGAGVQALLIPGTGMVGYSGVYAASRPDASESFYQLTDDNNVIALRETYGGSPQTYGGWTIVFLIDPTHAFPATPGTPGAYPVGQIREDGMGRPCAAAEDTSSDRVIFKVSPTAGETFVGGGLDVEGAFDPSLLVFPATNAKKVIFANNESGICSVTGDGQMNGYVQWSAPAIVSGLSGAYPVCAQHPADPGRVVMALLDDDGNLQVMESYDGGDTWGYPLAVTLGLDFTDCGRAGLCWLGTDVALVCWAVEDELWSQRMRFDGLGWPDAVQVAGDGPYCHLSALHLRGLVFIGALASSDDDATGFANSFWRSQDLGTTWTALGAPETPTAPNLGAMSQTGQILWGPAFTNDGFGNGDWTAILG